MTDKTLPLAPDGVFLTLQGEGLLAGQPMVFVRLAGCPVACPDCDTNYSVAERATVAEVVRRVINAAGCCRNVWLTGGEPAVFDLRPFVRELHLTGFRVALATSGIRPVPLGWVNDGADFLSVSPHFLDDRWVQRTGEQVNCVVGLNGLTLADIEAADAAGLFGGFGAKFVTPLWYAATGGESNGRAVTEWVLRNPGWRRGTQNHKQWGVM